MNTNNKTKIKKSFSLKLVQNPGQLDSILNAPYMQPMLQSMASNPEMARLLVENNPQLANNPEMREQVMRALPNMMSQVILKL